MNRNDNNIVNSDKISALYANFIDRGDYIELVHPIASIRMIQKGMAPNAMNWHEAVCYAKNLNLGGFTDWHLPTIEELKEIYTIQKICGIEKSDDSWFWSSTDSENDSGSACFIGFFKGRTGNSSKIASCGCVRCVR